MNPAGSCCGHVGLTVTSLGGGKLPASDHADPQCSYQQLMANESDCESTSDFSLDLSCDSFSFDEGSEEERCREEAEQHQAGYGVHPYMYEPRRKRRRQKSAEAGDSHDGEETQGVDGPARQSNRMETLDW